MSKALFRALVFDLDGTVVDSHRYTFDAFRFACQPFRVPPTDAEVFAAFGPSEHMILGGLLPAAVRDSAYARLQTYYETHAHRLAVHPSMRSLLRSCRAAGLPCGLAAGGAIYNAGTVTMAGTQFITNTCTGGHGGAGGKGGDGGGIYNATGAALHLQRCAITGNTAGNGARGGDGGHGLNGSISNSAERGGNGGAGGAGGAGGGIYGAGRVTLDGCTASGYNSGFGGAGGNGGGGGDGGAWR